MIEWLLINPFLKKNDDDDTVDDNNVETNKNVNSDDVWVVDESIS